MPITADVLKRKQTHFVLWRPIARTTAPMLVIDRLQPGNPPMFLGP